jgi:hypothetical protein
VPIKPVFLLLALARHALERREGVGYAAASGTRKVVTREPDPNAAQPSRAGMDTVSVSEEAETRIR